LQAAAFDFTAVAFTAVALAAVVVALTAVALTPVAVALALSGHGTQTAWAPFGQHCPPAITGALRVIAAAKATRSKREKAYFFILFS
jgi:hypothetical protein